MSTEVTNSLQTSTTSLVTATLAQTSNVREEITAAQGDLSALEETLAGLDHLINSLEGDSEHTAETITYIKDHFALKSIFEERTKFLNEFLSPAPATLASIFTLCAIVVVNLLWN